MRRLEKIFSLGTEDFMLELKITDARMILKTASLLPRLRISDGSAHLC
uniref:Uncharacterized protein n=1 Tax=Cyanothece sp. (strain PCC 7425 / ATCC 29141) TaxID=395961 RepID=B8HY31_CYAP4